jgi:hypothetical protein
MQRRETGVCFLCLCVLVVTREKRDEFYAYGVSPEETELFFSDSPSPRFGEALENKIKMWVSLFVKPQAENS